MILYALPLPPAIIKTLNSLRPNFWLFLGSVITSAVPLYENVAILLKYKPRAGESVAYETDPRYLTSSIVVLRSVIVFLLLIGFLAIQFVSTKLADTKVALEKLHLNRLATEKQAKAASQQSLKMLEEMEEMSKGAKPEVQKLSKENVALKTKLSEMNAVVENLNAKVKYNESEHTALIEEVSKLQKKLKISSVSDKKKD